MGRSRQVLSNDMGEHRPILKNNQNTYYLRFSFTPKKGIAFPKTAFFNVRLVLDMFRITYGPSRRPSQQKTVFTLNTMC